LPRLFSFAKNEDSTVASLSLCQDLDDFGDHFHLPLSEEAFGELLQLQTLMHSVPFSDDKDQWLPFSSSSVFNVSKAYKALMGTHIVNPAIKWLWKTCCQYKHKVFFWLLLNDRLNSRELLHRKGFFLPDYSCALCNSSGMESRNHLFFQCPFAKLCWQYLCPSWSAPTTTSSTVQVQDFIISLKQAISQPFALDLIILVCWVLWISRNDFIFKGVPPSIYRSRKLFKRELQLLLHKATRKSYCGLKSWVQNFN
jgi:hypothetical protein